MLKHDFTPSRRKRFTIKRWLGSGAYKAAYDIGNKEVLLTAWHTSELVEEQKYLRILKNLGYPVTKKYKINSQRRKKFVGKDASSIKRRGIAITERFSFSSRCDDTLIIKNVKQKHIDNINKLLEKVKKKPVFVDDLQLGFFSNGRVIIHDPLGVMDLTKDKDSNNQYYKKSMIRDLKSIKAFLNRALKRKKSGVL